MQGDRKRQRLKMLVGSWIGMFCAKAVCVITLRETSKEIGTTSRMEDAGLVKQVMCEFRKRRRKTVDEVGGEVCRSWS